MLDRIDQPVVIPSSIRHTEDDLNHVVVMDAENGKIFGLDNSAAVIWNALADSGSRSTAVTALIDRYGIERERAEHDVDGFVDRLVEAGLLAHEVPGE